MLIELLDGPYDGAELERAARPRPFVWVDAALRVLWSRPGSGRVLYRLVGRHGGEHPRVRYRHAELELARCGGCGCFTPRTLACALCGHSL